MITQKTNKIKICGLMRTKDIDAVNRAKPDFIGFVFAKSRRQIDKQTALLFRSRLDPDIPCVGVFVNQPADFILDLISSGCIQMVQLHGQEDQAFIQALKHRTDCPIIKAVRVESSEDIKKAEQLSCDYLLLDNGGGGTGRVFDWSLIESVSKPFFLAGGLTPDNIESARRIGAFCLDLSSGVETDKQKDAEKIIQVVSGIHNNR